jgi:predicted NBD/HSP70 family sugar kinase
MVKSPRSQERWQEDARMQRPIARTTPSLLRHMNAREVLGALQRHGPLSRADITRLTGISGPTITRTVSALLDANFLEEGGFQDQTLGRPGKFLHLASKTVSVLGAAIGAERCELVAAGLDGQIRENGSVTFATPSSYVGLVKALAQQARKLGESTGTTVLGLGISMPGLLNRRQKRTVFSPNLHQTDGHPLGEDLRERLPLEIAVLQESHALCLAERTYGAARGVSDFAMLDISEGLGLGVIQGGHIVEGHSGLAGELGHITVELDGKPCGCGNRGCLETVATDTALVAALSERLGKKVTLDDVIAQVRSGQLDASAELDHVLQYLAVGLAAVINLFNPSRLFLHGRFLDAEPALFDRLLLGTRRRALGPSMADCEIIRARGNKQLGAVAGIIHRLTTGREEPFS